MSGLLLSLVQTLLSVGLFAGTDTGPNRVFTLLIMAKPVLSIGSPSGYGKYSILLMIYPGLCSRAMI